MTSVGYGDQVPQRALGQFVACVCGVVGLIFIAFVLQSIASEFHGLMKTYSEYNAYLKLYDTDRQFNPKNDLSDGLDDGEEITVSVNGNEFIFKVSMENKHGRVHAGRFPTLLTTKIQKNNNKKQHTKITQNTNKKIHTKITQNTSTDF